MRGGGVAHRRRFLHLPCGVWLFSDEISTSSLSFALAWAHRFYFILCFLFSVCPGCFCSRVERSPLRVRISLFVFVFVLSRFLGFLTLSVLSVREAKKSANEGSVITSRVVCPVCLTPLPSQVFPPTHVPNPAHTHGARVRAPFQPHPVFRRRGEKKQRSTKTQFVDKRKPFGAFSGSSSQFQFDSAVGFLVVSSLCVPSFAVVHRGRLISFAVLANVHKLKSTTNQKQPEK